MNRVLGVDAKNKVVQVEAGILLKDLNTFLASVGLALPILGHIAEQSIAGAISTGTHGSGFKHPIIAAHIVNMTLLSSSGTTCATFNGRNDLNRNPGEIVSASATVNPEVFASAKLGLGAVGIITAVTLQCVDEFRLGLRETRMSWSNVKEEHQSIIRQHDHVVFWWIPYSDIVLARIMDRVDGSAASSRAVEVTPQLRWRQQNVEAKVYGVVLSFFKYFPFAKPLMPLVLNMLLKEGEYVGRSDLILTGSFPEAYDEMELHIPLRQFVPAMDVIQELIDESAHVVNFIVGIRFVARDPNPIYLSPMQNEDCVAIAVMMLKQPREFLKFAEELQVQLRNAQIEARPHWGKIHHFSRYQLGQLYPKFGEWMKARRQLDPHGTFLNEHLNELLPL